MSTWIIIYHHTHGTDAWIHNCEGQPNLNAIAEGLDDFESDRGEYLESVSVFGKWEKVE